MNPYLAAGMDGVVSWNYPKELPVVEHHGEIVSALRGHQVVVVVSDTGSGKTTQLPKMVAEALGPDGGRIGCTQPRRIAAASVAERVAEELRVPLGGYVGYQVRFEEKLSADTRIKFMTDGILLAETLGDPDLRQYHALILDEAHERSLNIDFLLGYLHGLLGRRPELKLVISSATLDAGSFAAFFASEARDVPVIEAPGRMFPVEELFLPPKDDEELPQQVCRAVEWLYDLEPVGDVLVFLPGEREIRDCADTLEGRGFANTEVLPLFARLGMADQQRVFHPGSKRRVVLATNVAETSLTIPRIACVVDSGVARMSRWLPGRSVQRLQVEPVSQASARQRKGRCGRVREGICVRLYGEDELLDRPEFTDPEIRRSSLAGVILRMKTLGFPEITEFPFLDPPAPKAVAEGYRTLRDIGALDRQGNPTGIGLQIARLPVEPRLGRILIAARDEQCLAEMLPIVAALETNDPRERPAEKAREADAAHAKWRDPESDFIGLLRMWRDVVEHRERPGRWRGNALRKACKPWFLNARRVIEWSNVVEELGDLLEREWKLRISRVTDLKPSRQMPYAAVHRALLAGVPRQIGWWDNEQKAYRSAAGAFFAVFPGSGLFGAPKRWEWVIAMELVETNRLWARRVARIDPEWVEEVAPHLCRSRFGDAHWDVSQGAVYGKETVLCGGLPIIAGRRVHYGRVDPTVAHAVFLREGLLGDGLKRRPAFLQQLESLREACTAAEEKLRRPGGLWSEDAVLRFLEEKIPQDIHSAAAFHRWVAEHPLSFALADVLDVDLDSLGLDGFPDELQHAGETYTLYYNATRGERDEGLTIGVHIDQLPAMPDWLPDWGVDGDLAERVELLIRGLPKDFRRVCQPVASLAQGFAEAWCGLPKDAPLHAALTQWIQDSRSVPVPSELFGHVTLPDALVTKLWVCDDDGEELAFGASVVQLKEQLSVAMKHRFESAANAEIGRTGMRVWDGEPLPESVQTPGGSAYPALVDEGGEVGILTFQSQALAAHHHCLGMARLLIKANEMELRHVRKRFPISLKTSVALNDCFGGRIGMDDLLLAVAKQLLNGELFRSPVDFRSRSDATRGQWYEAAARLGNVLDGLVDEYERICGWLARHRGERHLDPVIQSIQEQLAWLFRDQFLCACKAQEFLNLERYMAGIRSRIKRLESLPLARDLEKLERFSPHWKAWHQTWCRSPEFAELWSHGYDLEEFRISLFAPDIQVQGRISEKRLETAWAKLVFT